MIGGCNVVLELHLLLSSNMMSNVTALPLMFLNLDGYGIEIMEKQSLVSGKK